MANNFIFKGIQQVKALPSNPNKGVIYFVREHANGVPTGNAKVYFGERLYGEVASTRLNELQSAITANSNSITAIQQTIGEWSEKFNGSISTIASAVIAVSGTATENTAAIEKLNGNSDTNGSVAYAVANAKNELLGNASTEYNTLGKLEGQIKDVAQSVADKNVTAEGDEYVTATTANNKVTVNATSKTKAAIALAESALQASGITTGSANGTIAVNGSNVNVYGLGSAAYKNEGDFDANGAAAAAEKSAKEYASGYTNSVINSLDANFSGDDNEFVKIQLVQEDGKITGFTVNEDEIKHLQTFTTAHTSDNKIHITDAERAAWNKAKSDIDVFLTGNTSNNVVDTLKEIQDYITNDGAAADEMVKNIASAQTRADEAYELADAAQTADEVSDAINAKVATLSGTPSGNSTFVTVKLTQEDGKVTNVEVNDTVSSHTNNADIHVTTTDKANWNAAEKNAKEYASGYTESAITALNLANTYEAKGEAGKVQTNLNTYTASTKTVLDSIESRLTAITDNAVTEITSSGKTISLTENEGSVNVEVNTLAHNENNQDGYVIFNKDDNGALYGVMYYGGDDAE